LIASSTATVRDGSAPAAPVRNTDATPTAVVPEAVVPGVAVLEAAAFEASGPPGVNGKDGMWGVDIMYRISYMTGVRA
jgi:hypothetical protein